MIKDRNVLGKPHGYLLLAFVLEIILVLIGFFFLNGKNFFFSDPQNLRIIFPLGILTFVSVFFSLIFSNQRKLFDSFNKIMQTKGERFIDELKNLVKEGDRHKIRECLDRYDSLKEYQRYVKPFLWLYISIFTSIITLLINLTTMDYREILTSILIHSSILSTLFLVTSVASLTIAYLAEENC